MTAVPASSPPVIRGWHVLVGFVLFFGLVIAVNVAFIMAAYRTFPGETSVTPYEDGVAYNRTLGQMRAQAALGWRLTAGVDADGRLRVEAFDRGDHPLGGLHLSARLQRPATEAGAHVVVFEEAAPGVYLTPPSPMHGAWDAEITAHGPAGQAFLAGRRLVLP